MPKEREIREEDVGERVPWHIQFMRNFQKPDDDSLPANTQLSYTMTTSMAELSVMEDVWADMIWHQVSKAKEYCDTLEGNDKIIYQRRIDNFIDEHYVEDKEGVLKPKFASTSLRKMISLYSLSILGKHHDDTKELSQSMIESIGGLADKQE
jgi:hypothetical protein